LDPGRPLACCPDRRIIDGHGQPQYQTRPDGAGSTVESYDWNRVAPGLRLTVSIGLCNALSSADVRGLLERADASLYAAKRAGRNRVEVAAT
jgi:GGDEF domain-containing protein